MKGEAERRHRIAHAHRGCDGETGDEAGKIGNINFGEIRIGAERGDQIGKLHRAEAAIQPMAKPVIAGIAPDIAARRKERKGPRIPAPQIEIGGVEHRRAGDGRDRIVGGVRPEFQMGFEKAALDQIVAFAIGIIRQTAFAGFGIDEDIGLVRALVDRRAAQLGEPDGFRLRHPGGGAGAFAAIGPVVMGIAPPVPDILGAEDPGLAEPVGDRRADLRLAVGGAGVIPVVILAALNVGREIGRIVDRGGAVRGIVVTMRGAIAPIGKLHVIVDADEVDIRIRPQRIEVEEQRG